MSSIQQKIDEILSMRKPYAEKLETKIKNLDELLEALNNFWQICMNDEDENKIDDFKNLVDKIKNMKIKLEQMRDRFARDTINIGVVGNMRQGKSTLLQTLTGLDHRFLPTTSGGATTGVRSQIINRKGDTECKVVFYDEETFMQEVIKPYFDKLNLQNMPLSLHGLKEFKLEKYEESHHDHEEVTYYRRFKRYLDHISAYESLLTGESQSVKPDELWEYVSQRNPEDSNQESYKYLAVKEVKIYTHLPSLKNEKISFVDTPGLGEITAGAQERLLKVLERDVDLMFMIRKPESTGDEWQTKDTEIFQLAQKANNIVPLKEWIFLVLNLLGDGSNKANCEYFDKKKLEFHITVADSIIVNCCDQNEVQTKLLKPALEYLANNITRLDGYFENYYKNEIVELTRDVQGLFQNYGVDVDESDDVYIDNFDDLWDKFSENLAELVEKYQKLSENADDAFTGEIDKAIQKAKEQDLFTKERLKTIKSQTSESEALLELLRRARPILTSMFSDLDPALHNVVDKLKSNLISCFKESGLQFISINYDDYESNDALKLIYNKIPDKYCILKQAFSNIINFKLNYRGMLQHHIRRAVDFLHPDNKEIKANLESEKDIDEKINCLSEYYQEALYKIEVDLNKMKTDPNMACYAVIEEFRDQVVVRGREVQKEWRKFIRRQKAEIWPDVYQKQAQFEKVQRALAALNSF